MVWSQQPVSVIQMGTPSSDISAMPCSTAVAAGLEQAARASAACVSGGSLGRAHQWLRSSMAQEHIAGMAAFD